MEENAILEAPPPEEEHMATIPMMSTNAQGKQLHCRGIFQYY